MNGEVLYLIDSELLSSLLGEPDADAVRMAARVLGFDPEMFVPMMSDDSFGQDFRDHPDATQVVLDQYPTAFMNHGEALNISPYPVIPPVVALLPWDEEDPGVPHMVKFAGLKL